MIGLVVTFLILALALLTPVIAILAKRRRGTAPVWLKRVFQIWSAVNATLYVISFVALLCGVVWFLAHSK